MTVKGSVQTQFDSRKAHYMRELASAVPDRSRKGFADYPVLPILDHINALHDFFTTSSCSGRVAVYKEHPTVAMETATLNTLSGVGDGRDASSDDAGARTQEGNVTSVKEKDDSKVPDITHISTQLRTHHNEPTSQYIPPAMHKAEVSVDKRKGGGWLFVSHEVVAMPTDDQELIKMYLPEHNSIDSDSTKAHDSNKDSQATTPLLIYLKMEPVILHVEARSVERARDILNVALSCGFKSSGIVTTPKRHIIHIRGNLKIDAPIATVSNGLIVSPSYLRILTQAANHKMRQNLQSMDRFLSALQAADLDNTHHKSTAPKESKEEKRLRKLAAGMAIQKEVQQQKRAKREQQQRLKELQESES
ncbi:hypothetical protein SARC_06110 [Sphaeroforma arctica JP610]|uniref:tRNA(Phe) 7-[(3-amino-3-carboxypropyl)-4-demethylwyosine(37)-N(4)]-methyltransferase n=1 Tax=Sphaeroforma arctica JP610 TaxID=667725 RepID=A0A0L0FXM7_9EUKA|nr:hypothetical protein SARC_06110 [Sphaeroforma arctica JP610]KNC81575.1 hypothetical protein SARC_06110 [Sphaeroforma arctica JP610]|eukprot:XP_014155477.1 hypothetical protein SARC_06110 [Sphaeroforma arctica JP610]